MSDFNYFSITNDGYTIDAGGPNPQTVTELPTDNKFTPANPGQYNDILKLSNKQGLSLTNVQVSHGQEDCVDINNHCANITLQGEFGVEGSGRQCFTIKGESKDIFISGVIHTPGNSTDVEIGNWSDQSYGLSSNIHVDLRRADGKPVRVRIGRAENVQLGANCKKDVIGSLLMTAYWWLKWTVRKISGIKVGEKGPSWL